MESHVHSRRPPVVVVCRLEWKDPTFSNPRLHSAALSVYRDLYFSSSRAQTQLNEGSAAAPAECWAK